jgi:hypothetical protein
MQLHAIFFLERAYLGCRTQFERTSMKESFCDRVYATSIHAAEQAISTDDLVLLSVALKLLQRIIWAEHSFRFVD